MASLTYNPAVFRVPDLDAAKAIILTPEGDQSTERRWTHETPYLTELLGDALRISPGDLIVDFGCGVGRMSKALTERFGCRMLGVDFSQDMRGLGPAYVGSGRFSVVSDEVFAELVDKGLQADAVISVWVLQHCLDLAGEIERLYRVLKPGGGFGLVNTLGRAVPTVEQAWASDGLDIRALMEARFTKVAEGQLDLAVVGRIIHDHCFWAAYQKPA